MPTTTAKKSMAASSSVTPPTAARFTVETVAMTLLIGEKFLNDGVG